MRRSVELVPLHITFRPSLPSLTLLITIRKANRYIQEREGPVQFEKDTDDPFNINEMISEVTGGAAGGTKRYGIQESDERASKRVRVDDDDDNNQ